MAIKDAGIPEETRLDVEVPKEVDRDQYQRPLILGPDGVVRGYTRASSFAEPLEDMYGVNKWARGMVAYGMGLRRDLQLEAAGVEDPNHPDEKVATAAKKTLKDIQERAYEASGANLKANLGTGLHALTCKIDQGVDVGDQGEFNPVLEKYRELIAPFEVHATELFVANHRYQSAGTFDDLLSPRGHLEAPDGEVFGPGDTLIGDKKTSASARYFGAKFCGQLKVYQGGQPVTVRQMTYRGELRNVGVTTDGGWFLSSPNWGLILHLPSDPRLLESAGWYWVPLHRAERMCELAFEAREIRKERGLIVPVKQLPTVEHPDEARRGRARVAIASARSASALTMVWRQHRDVWDDELSRAALAKKAELEVAS